MGWFLTIGRFLPVLSSEGKVVPPLGLQEKVGAAGGEVLSVQFEEALEGVRQAGNDGRREGDPVKRVGVHHVAVFEQRHDRDKGRGQNVEDRDDRPGRVVRVGVPNAGLCVRFDEADVPIEKNRFFAAAQDQEIDATAHVPLELAGVQIVPGRAAQATFYVFRAGRRLGNVVGRCQLMFKVLPLDLVVVGIAGAPFLSANQLHYFRREHLNLARRYREYLVSLHPDLDLVRFFLDDLAHLVSLVGIQEKGKALHHVLPVTLVQLVQTF